MIPRAFPPEQELRPPGDELALASFHHHSFRGTSEFTGVDIPAGFPGIEVLAEVQRETRSPRAFWRPVAVRVARIRLLPPWLAALAGDGRLAGLTLDDVLWRGVCPRARAPGAKPGEVCLPYLQTHVERDVRSLVNLKDADGEIESASGVRNTRESIRRRSTRLQRGQETLEIRRLA
jgi:hypothetical protein